MLKTVFLAFVLINIFAVCRAAVESEWLVSNGDLRQLGDVWSQNDKTQNKINFNIELTNTSNHELKIDRIATSCSCTTTSSRFATIAAGKSLIIPVEVKLLGREGLLRGAVLMELNDHSTKKIVFEVNVNVPLRCLPQAIAINGTMGDKKSFNFVIYEALSREQKEHGLPSLSVANSVAGLDVSYKTASVEASDLPSTVNGYYYQKYTLEGTFEANKSGAFTGYVEVADKTNSLHLSVPMQVDVKDDIYLEKNSILLGSIKNGDTKAYQVKVVSFRKDDAIEEILIENKRTEFHQDSDDSNSGIITADCTAVAGKKLGLTVIHGELVMKSGRHLPFSLVAFIT